MLKRSGLSVCISLLGFGLLAVFLFSSCNKKGSADVSFAVKWQKVSIPYTDAINTLYFASKDTGYAIGSGFYDTKLSAYRTPYLITYDGGDTWKLDTLHVSNFVVSSMFASGAALYMNGNLTKNRTAYRGLYRSTDRTKTWQLMDSSVYMNPIQFWTPAKGFLTYSTNIYATADSGHMFNIAVHVDQGGFGNPVMVNNQTAYVIGPGKMYKTTDAGTSWNPIAPFTYNYVILGMQFINATTGYAFYDEGLDGIAGNIVPHNVKLIKTTDGALTWTSVNDHILADYGYCGYSYFSSEAQGFMASSTTIYSTADGGKTWQPEYDGGTTFTGFSGLYFSPASVGFAYGYAGIYKKIK